MLFKVVLDKQIRVFDCKDTPTIKLIQGFVCKTFSNIKNYRLYYLDQDNDQIAIETDLDLSVLLEAKDKKPKIYVSPIIDDLFESTVQMQIDSKLSQKKQFSKNERKEQEKNLKKEEMEMKKVEKAEVQKLLQQVHQAKCDSCGESPIKGIRFKCGVCSNFDLCQNCEALQGHLHPLIKIRLNEQAPISCKVKFGELEASKIAEKLKYSSIGKKETIVYESAIEREQIVISYLGNLLGEDEFEKHKQFALICKSQTYEDLIEEYLTWIESGKDKKVNTLVGVFKWIKDYIGSLKIKFD